MINVPDATPVPLDFNDDANAITLANLLVDFITQYGDDPTKLTVANLYNDIKESLSVHSESKLKPLIVLNPGGEPMAA